MTDPGSGPMITVLISGRVGSGKSSLAAVLSAAYGFSMIRTREAIISNRPSTPHRREALQQAGDELDVATGGRWVAEHVGANAANDSRIVVDAVRTADQVTELRKVRSGSVMHVHLAAPRITLEARYKRLAGASGELASYETVAANRTEASVDDLSAVADLVINTGQVSAGEVVSKVANAIGLKRKL